MFRFVSSRVAGKSAIFIDGQTIKERRSYERRSERRSRFHERDVSAAHIFNHERKKSAAHSISWWAQNERKKLLKKKMNFSLKNIALIESKFEFYYH